MTTTDTTYYLISSRTTGSDLGVFAGRTEAEALDAMARDAGYKDYDYLTREIDPSGRDGITIEEITREEADRLREEWGIA